MTVELDIYHNGLSSHYIGEAEKMHIFHQLFFITLSVTYVICNFGCFITLFFISMYCTFSFYFIIFILLLFYIFYCNLAVFTTCY